MNMLMRILGSLFLLASRLVVGGVLGFAAFAKLWGQNASMAFYEAVRSYELLPKHLAIVATFAFPWVEAVVAICLLIGFWARAAALLAIMLFVSFIYAIGAVMRSGRTIEDCGCLGKLNEYIRICPEGTPSWCNIWLDVGLLALAAVVLFLGPGMFALDRLLRPRPLPPPVLFEEEQKNGRPV